MGSDLGTIQVIFGPMFSGKSTELIRRIRRYVVAGQSCIVIKYSNDLRYSAERISTHDKTEWGSTPCRVLEDVKEEAMEHDVIGIDEGQFFTDIVPFCESMANAGKVVIVAALDGTFQRVGFGSILNLVPKAENVVKLNAVCSACQRDAAFSRRTVPGEQTELIGGKKEYESLCRGCFHERSHRE